MRKVKICVINIAGGAGKSTFTKHVLVPQIPQCVQVAVEDWNTGDGPADLEISASSFYALAAQLNTDSDNSYVLDVGTSNSRAMFKHFKDLVLTREEIDYWVVPVRSGSKERLDTLKTLAELLELGIEPSSIAVVAQAVTDTNTYDSDFGDLRDTVTKQGIVFARQPLLFNDVYNLTKGSEQTIFDIVADKPDFKKMRHEHAGDAEALLRIGQQMVLYSLACTAVQNAKAVFESLPVARVISP